jgi:hypothetical protein
MPFATKYKQFIGSEVHAIKSRLKIKNVYRISSYEYSDGTKKLFTPTESSLVFLLEIKDKKLFCLKLSEVEPKIFFQWMKAFFKSGLSDDDFTNSKHLNELLVKSELHNTKIPFRSYKMDGIKKIEEVNFKKEVLKSYYK